MIDTIFEGKTYTKHDMRACEFDGCAFKKCIFVDCDLSETYFRDCVFKSCNLTMAKIENTVLKDCIFEDCKLSGIEFGVINQFMFGIECKRCIMNYVSFVKNRLERAKFSECQITDALFSNCNMQKSIFEKCNLQNTLFEQNNMEKADFLTAINYVIDPQTNRMKGAQFGLSGVWGLLVKYDLRVDPSL